MERKRSESRKKKTVQCTVFQAWPLAASPNVGARMRAGDESHLLFCCFSKFIVYIQLGC